MTRTIEAILLIAGFTLVLIYLYFEPQEWYACEGCKCIVHRKAAYYDPAYGHFCCKPCRDEYWEKHWY